MGILSDQLSTPLSDDQLAHLKAIIKDVKPQQLAWISGYLYGLQNHLSDDFAKAKDIQSFASESKITILSASQTGNARKIAEQLQAEIKNAGYTVNLQKAGEYKYKQIADEELLFIVTSTQGEGDAPEEAIPLYKYLFSKKAPDLKNLKFAVFGLGDSSYQNFCKAGKDFDSRLAELGASRILERVDADLSFLDKANLWKKSALEYLKEHKVTETGVISSSVDKISLSDSIVYDKEKPFTAKIIVNQKITSRYSEKDVRHIEIDLAGSEIRYRPGDALGVWYKNDSKLVNEILDIFNFDGNFLISLNETEIALSDALTHSFELTQNTTAILEKYAVLNQNEELEKIISDRSLSLSFVKNTPLVDTFHRFPANISPEQLLSVLRPLTPRYYSIASSQDEVGEEVHITVGIVDYVIDSVERKGGASGYLSSLTEDDKINIFIEKNDNFRLPQDADTRVIMIGPGTGIAPFRAFMQQRDADSASGKNWLFFGNPHFTSDFLYQLEWQQYHKSGLLSDIDLAWSRDQVQKIYVQDRLREHGAEIWHWINNGAHIYVCGDAEKMAKDVDCVLLDIIIKYGNMESEDAELYLNDLRSDRRYQRDIY